MGKTLHELCEEKYASVATFATVAGVTEWQAAYWLSGRSKDIPYEKERLFLLSLGINHAQYVESLLETDKRVRRGTTQLG